MTDRDRDLAEIKIRFLQILAETRAELRQMAEAEANRYEQIEA